MKGRTIRGIRQTFPPGAVIGRPPGSGNAAPQIITIQELGAQLARGILQPAGGRGFGSVLPKIAPDEVLANIGVLPAIPVGVPIATVLAAGGGVLGTVAVVTQTTDVYLE